MFWIFESGENRTFLSLKEKREVFRRADIELEEVSRAAFAVVEKRTARYRERRVHWRIYE